MSSGPTEDPSRQTTGGWILFLVYGSAYGTFVLANAFWPSSMSVQPIPGVNWAVLGGVGLIALTLAIAVSYSWLRRAGKSTRLSRTDRPV